MWEREKAGRFYFGMKIEKERKREAGRDTERERRRIVLRK